MNRGLTGRLLRALVAAGLTGALLWQSDPADVWRVTSAAEVPWILVAVAFVFVDRALMAYRWFVLLAPVDPNARPPLGRVLRVFFVSSFVGTFLPASIGGDLVRAYQLAQLGVNRAASLASVLVDRLLGVASILVLALLGLVLAGHLVGTQGVGTAVGATSIACAAALGLIFSPRLDRLVKRAVARLGWPRVEAAAASLVGAVQQYARYRRDLVVVLACSIGVQIIRTIQAYCLGRAVGIGEGPLLYLAVIPVILLIMLLPISVNGLGTSQLAFLWFFGRAQVDTAQAFALSILFVALGVVGNLPGGLLYAFGSREAIARVRT